MAQINTDSLGAEDSSGGILPPQQQLCLGRINNGLNGLNGFLLLGEFNNGLNGLNGFLLLGKFNNGLNGLNGCNLQGVHLSQVHQPSNIDIPLVTLVHLRQVHPLEGTQTICVNL